MEEINKFEAIASADDYWIKGVEAIIRGQEVTEVVDSYVEVLVQGFIDKKYRLEDIRKIVQAASRLDGESSMVVKHLDKTNEDLSAADLLEFRARRLAHHALRKARNIVSSKRSIWLYGRENQISM